ncbi:response regulator [Deinococcus roseus]|uniref:DNA-binding response regulator n=1 Tax=Deinococcus roseus TaxID=392414 RepID=A0ABQ2D2R2_9DEIO|nr:response regulator transcription factor [Deinococcus roseus]GGJ39120.1 DNA-binding response regulator [Deinococcus roseus]
MTETLRILIADDHKLFREGVKALLSVLPGIEVIGEAHTGKQVVDLALQLQPDVVLMDIQMPEMSGLEATRTLMKHSPNLGILVVSMFDDDDNVFEAMKAGARGYLLKGADHEELIRAIHAVGRGEALFAPGIARKLMGFFQRPRSLPDLFPELTEREREILLLISRGHSNPEIARKIEVADKTVRNHITSIFSKLQVSTRTEAILRAREAGL